MVRLFGCVAALVVLLAACGGSQGGSSTARSPSAVRMSAIPPAAWSVCQRFPVMRPACPHQVPGSDDPPRGSDVSVACLTGAQTPRDRCREAEWSYIAGNGLPPGVPRGEQIEWHEPPGPPWFVHVDITASRDGSPCVWPHEAGARALTDRLLNMVRARPVSFGTIDWARTKGQLILAPSYPNGGEVGGHLEFCYSANYVHYAVTLHAWTSTFRFAANGRPRTLARSHGSSAPAVLATLKTIILSIPGNSRGAA